MGEVAVGPRSGGAQRWGVHLLRGAPGVWGSCCVGINFAHKTQMRMALHMPVTSEWGTLKRGHWFS